VKLLIVEDSPEIVARIRRLLEADGAVEIVGSAPSNGEAIALFERHEPELVTLDVRLADGVSLGALRAMMMASRPPRVIVVTDHAMDSYRHRYLAAGASHVLSKTDLASLPEMIRSLYLPT
jgi:DNA-binding NarL/FixJ family response regulator